MNLTDAIQTLLKVEDDEQLADALNQHPELLTEEAIEILLHKSRQAASEGEANAAAYLEALAEFLDRLMRGDQVEHQQDPLAEALEALAQVETPEGLQRVFVEYPELLLSDTVEALRARSERARLTADPEAAERWERVAAFLDHARGLLARDSWDLGEAGDP